MRHSVAAGRAAPRKRAPAEEVEVQLRPHVRLAAERRGRGQAGYAEQCDHPSGLRCATAFPRHRS
ncbi:MAG: hypothetical protein M3069_03870, partial [Chloroflexota bacterium]|nr:hypothetical protein [Chloroflexota bacterium]